MSTGTNHETAHDTVHPELGSNEYGEGHHGATDKQYIVIALILALITAAEVTLSYIDVGAIFLPALLIMMAAKFIIVVSFFMHLKFDNRIFSFMFYLGVLLAIFVYCGALATFHFFNK
jgi:cytochrome c oxidase subunit 4